MRKVIAIILVLLTISLCGVMFSSCDDKEGNNIIGINNTVSYQNESAYSVGNFEYQSANIGEIEINWVFGNITVIESDKAELSVKESGTNLKEEEKLRYLIEGRTLIIQFWKSRYKSDVTLSDKKDLTIEIPKNIDLEISQVSGNVNGDNLNLRSMDIETVSGNTVIHSINTDILDIENVSGSVTLETVTAREIDVETVSGVVNLKVSKVNNINVDSVSADVTISLGGMGASIIFESVSGRNNGETSYGDRSCKIEVETVSGNLDIQP